MMKQMITALCVGAALTGGMTVCAYAQTTPTVQVAPVAAVQKAEFTDAQGNTIEVITLADGTVAVSVNGGNFVSGAAAQSLLSTAGITLSVAPNGTITSTSVASGAKVTAAPVAATPADTPTVSTSTTSSAPAAAPLPANVSIGSFAPSASIASGSGSSTPATPPTVDVNEKPTSK